MKHTGPCAMGVDVGSMLNVVVGFKPKDKQLRILYLARVSSFNDVHDIAQRFGVKCAVIDMEPEFRKAREFAQAEPYPVFLCDYQDRIVSGPLWDEEKKLIKVNRTEICDATHDLVSSSGLLSLPRRNEEVRRSLRSRPAISPRSFRKIRRQDQGSIDIGNWERIIIAMRSITSGLPLRRSEYGRMNTPRCLED